MKRIMNRINLVIIMLLFYPGVTWAEGDKFQCNINWFTSDASHLLNRSSVELATGHVNRGIHLAHKSLRGELNTTDELIANYNLCMGYLAVNKNTVASSFCARAFELAQGPYRVTRLRGALRLVRDTEKTRIDNSLSPLHLLVSNIQQQSLEMRISLLIHE